MKKTLSEAFADRILPKLTRNDQALDLKPYTFHFYISEHGAGSELRNGEEIIASSQPAIFMPEGWSEQNSAKLENWIEKTIASAEVNSAKEIKISWHGSLS